MDFAFHKFQQERVIIKRCGYFLKQLIVELQIILRVTLAFVFKNNILRYTMKVAG